MTVPCHAFCNISQLHTGQRILDKYFQMRYIGEQNNYYVCGQLCSVECVHRECPLHPAEQDFPRKAFLEINPSILLDTKKGLGVVAKCLDSLP